MAEQTCGSSVQACAGRVAVLEQDGVPLPGPSNLYVTDALMKLVATAVLTKGVDIEVLNACGAPSVLYKDRDRLKRYDLALDMITLSPEFENMLTGGQLFTSGGFTVGGSVPAVGTIEAPFGVSVELWSKHIVNGDIDPVWPYIQWILPRSYWSPITPVAWDNNAMPRSFTGYTTENQNWFNGPANDWAFNSTRSIAWRFTKTLPVVKCGAQALAGS